MKVSLINYTAGALDLLLMTKNTRLKNTDDNPESWSPEKKQEHLEYMLDTIKSSWEFVDYTFNIEGVSRAFTHQLVRTRQASYAQESQRTVDVRGSPVLRPDNLNQRQGWVWDDCVEDVLEKYAWLVDQGLPVQDARGILPTNMTTSIICKMNLRTLSEMSKLRLCTRTQGEYQQVFREMRKAILAVHEWAEPFLQVHCVANGTCAFPRYGKTSCNFYDPRMDLDSLKKEVAVKFWNGEIQVAVPVANKGKTM